ncbi:MAG: amino acid ABC transporter substrate-binding protein [Pseudomonadota bacterium]
MRTTVIPAVLASASLVVGAGSSFAGTLSEVQERGTLSCGVTTPIAGFAAPDAGGTWVGFDVGLCRAVAAAVLGDPMAVSFIETTPDSRFETLGDGSVDLLARNTTWSFHSDVGRDFTFVGINYYDGQGFMVPKSLGYTSARELNGVSICVKGETTSALNLEDFFRINNIDYQPVLVDTNEEAQDLYLAGDCQAFTSDASGLAATRAGFITPGEHTILPEMISKEPLGPLVREGDDEWADIVRWVLFALIAAEELGITSTNVAEMASERTANPEINRILGTEGELAAMIGLNPGWATAAILAGGNYGELFEKHIGENTSIGLPRGLNAQWTNGGLIYAPPFR